MGYIVFTGMIFLSVLLPIVGLVTHLVLSLFEKELNSLELENTRVRLEKELQLSEYQQLNQQIQPHFLFNTLNAFLSLSRLGKYERMTKAMEQFSLFLRYKYQEKGRLVPFTSELDHTRHYLHIQQLRFGERLKVSYAIDPEAVLTLLPPYTLQTLVENAFKHGLEKKRGEKRLVITLKREGNWVSLEVRDNGPVPFNSKTVSPGFGLKNLRQRFKLIFDLYTNITLRREGDWTSVTAVWPYTPEDEL